MDDKLRLKITEIVALAVGEATNEKSFYGRIRVIKETVRAIELELADKLATTPQE